MDSRELVVSDMKALITTCDETIADFQIFGERNMQAAGLIEEVCRQLSALKGYWEAAYQYVTARGYDEEGEYSHAKLGYSVSLAYKKYSEIVSGFRFSLDRLKILEEYNKFEMYNRKQRR
ncbi:MAG: hypothetical protein K6E75_03150 [Lachnospiraceae bacterium]|nr:hypothetical protein [Lachnospiraceae bacterium]